MNARELKSFKAGRVVPETKTLIFLHGGPGYGDYLEEFFKEAFPENIDCVFYTQSHGADIGISMLLKEVDEHVQGKPSPYLVGHSWGGVLAQKYLEAYPDKKMKGLILMSSFIDYQKLNEAFIEATRKAGLEHPTLTKVFYTDEELSASKGIRQKIKTYDEGFFKKIHHDFLDEFHGEEFFKRLDLPILNIFGTDDLRTPAPMLQELADLNPRVENLEVPNAGHFPFILPENRKIITSGVLNFLGT